MHLQVRLKHAGCSAFSKQQQHRQVGPTSQCDSNTTWPWQWSADSPELKPEHTQHLESDQAGCLSLTITLLSGLAECSSGVAAPGSLLCQFKSSAIQISEPRTLDPTQP